MKTYLFDGSKNGLFTCIFESFYRKEKPCRVTNEACQTGLLDEIVKIETDNEKSERVYNCVKQCKTKYIVSDLKTAFKSGDKNRFDTIFFYLKTVIENKTADVSTAFSLSEVLAFNDLKSRIFYEMHRFKGFLRFMETKDGYFYACYEPDNDITELLVPHFKARLGSPFIIHDVKRNIIALCNGKEYRIVFGGETPVTVFLSENECDLQNLWKTYYKNVNIEERKNARLMQQYLPERYWKHLSEKQDIIEDF